MPDAASLPALRRRCNRSAPLPPARESAALYLRLPAEQTALFRFLLEARENVAYFTVLDRREALIKVVFSPHMREQAEAALADIARSVSLERLPYQPDERD